MKYMRSIPRSIPPKQTPKHTSEAYPLDKPSSGDTVFPDKPKLFVGFEIIGLSYTWCAFIIHTCLRASGTEWLEPASRLRSQPGRNENHAQAFEIKICIRLGRPNVIKRVEQSKDV